MRKKTYVRKIWDWLAETKVLQTGSSISVVEQPDRVARIRVAARVANVAQTCLRYVTAEFPKSSPLCLAGAFALPPSDQAPLVSGETNNRLRLLARLMKWEQSQEDALVVELNEAIGKAMTYENNLDSSHLVAWDAAVEGGNIVASWPPCGRRCFSFIAF